MKIRYYNGLILTMKEPIREFAGELWTEDDKIIYVGEAKKGNDIFDREINLNGNLIMPGFKNAHTHSAMTFLRSLADDKSLNDWLYQDVFPREAKLNDDDIYWLTKLAFMEYLSGGITACFDMYFGLNGFAAAQSETGFRTVLCGSVNDFGGSADSLAQEYSKYNSLNSLMSYQIGFHAEYTTNPDLMKNIAKLANTLKVPVYAHNSETLSEVNGCIERYKTTPTAYMDSIGMFEYGGGGFHCVYLSEEDKEIFAKKKLHVITNPASNMKLASGIAPIEELYQRGINIGIGTDGAASNNALNMFREMYLCSGLQKIKKMDPVAMPADRVLRAATVGSAMAMGLNECDYLETGKQADFIEINLNMPNMQPVHNIVKNIVYSGSNSNIVRTVIAGKILFENNKYNIGEKESTIYERVKSISDRICQ